MSDKTVTIIISDLHLGGGAADPGDDHVYQDNQLCRFIEKIPEASQGKVELFINGDFLEFAQVKPEVFKPVSSKLWCSQEESKEKLKVIIDGHKDIFDALNTFQGRKNQVTIAAGNHDVDLYWPDVQNRLKEVIGDGLKFELGQDAYFRYGRRLVIGHGHAYDPANSFKNWADPIDKNEQRLEMCPGTLFMVKFVNWLEKDYSFSDNIKPVTALARILWGANRDDFKNAAKILFQILYKNPLVALGVDKSGNMKGFSRSVLTELQTNPIFLDSVTELYRKACNQKATADAVKQRLSSEEQVTEFLKELLLRLDPEEWLPIISAAGGGSLSADSPTHLSIIHNGIMNDKTMLRQRASDYFASGIPEVVVFGHTHQPDEWRGLKGDWDGGYFNPGSWTRYVDLEKAPNLTIDDLKNESDFPYQLNFIRVEQAQSGKLRADKICFEEKSGEKYGATPRPSSFMMSMDN